MSLKLGFCGGANKICCLTPFFLNCYSPVLWRDKGWRRTKSANRVAQKAFSAQFQNNSEGKATASSSSRGERGLGDAGGLSSKTPCEQQRFPKQLVHVALTSRKKTNNSQNDDLLFLPRALLAKLLLQYIFCFLTEFYLTPKAYPINGVPLSSPEGPHTTGITPKGRQKT